MKFFGEAELESIQRIRENWNTTTDLPPDEYRESGVTPYQFWLEASLMYAYRQLAELTYERNAWADKYRSVLEEQIDKPTKKGKP